MMCSIHIDESTIHMSVVVWPSRLCVPFSEKLDNLFVCLDNRCMMHIFQCDMHVSGHVGIETSPVTMAL
jgi:hypothetical protein